MSDWNPRILGDFPLGPHVATFGGVEFAMRDACGLEVGLVTDDGPMQRIALALLDDQGKGLVLSFSDEEAEQVAAVLTGRVAELRAAASAAAAAALDKAAGR